MKKEIKKFLEFNGQSICFLSVDGEYWIALKPICEAMGILWKKQHEKLQNGDDIFGELSQNWGMVAADGKIRKMTSLPEKYIYGWIFGIPLGSVNDESKENLKVYKKECCDMLYEHFHGAITQRKDLIRQKAANSIMIDKLKNKIFGTPEAQKLGILEVQKKAIVRSLKNQDNDQFEEELELFKENVEKQETETTES